MILSSTVALLSRGTALVAWSSLGWSNPASVLHPPYLASDRQHRWGLWASASTPRLVAFAGNRSIPEKLGQRPLSESAPRWILKRGKPMSALLLGLAAPYSEMQLRDRAATPLWYLPRTEVEGTVNRVVALSRAGGRALRSFERSALQSERPHHLITAQHPLWRHFEPTQ